jgi:phospholipid/cholesterol/gamma-HCH transport system substrate-binding protein
MLTVGVFLAIGAIAALAIGTLTRGGSSGYMVRAVFDNSSFVIPGEDVKAAGVTIGTIDAVQLTPQNKAAIVLRIENRQFEPFRADAHCEIGLESLLGEQFVQCTPTQPPTPGAPTAPALPVIASGPGKGQHLLPVQNTTTPVGIDLFADITRLPQQQRLQVIISELGAGLAGNGHELNAALLRADPALQQTDRVIAVLASQDRQLSRLVDESDRILAPLAAQRAHVGGFIQHVAEVALAAAQQGQAIEQSFQSFPPFLRQLQPAAVRLTALADQITPALDALRAQTPAINATVSGLGPFLKASIPEFQTLGNVAQRGETAFPRLHPIALQLLRLGTPLVPLASDLGALSQSFDNAGGIEDVMRFIYYYTGTINGEDALGHYIRSSFEVGCSARLSSQAGGCGSTFATTTVQAGQASANATAATVRDLATAAVARKTIGSRHLASKVGASTKTLLDYLLRP